MGLFRRVSGLGRARRPAARTPDDCVVWAIGDIHGRDDLLAVLLAEIDADLARTPAGRKAIVCLGDYIDRGPDSRRVLDRLCALSDRPDIETHFLRGNHEDRFEAFMTDPDVGPGWCEFGGRETLWSYGVEPPPPRADEQAWVEASAALKRALPDAHRLFLTGQAWSLVLGGYFFAHAGARPGVLLDRQAVHDLMWIRAAFLDDPRTFDKVVVHGHTPAAEVHSDDRRIGLDTGAYATGVLSAVRLEGEGRRLLQTSGGATARVLPQRGL